MTGITSSISNLLQSILDIFTGILRTIFSSVQGVFAVSGTLVQDIVNMFQGLLGFLLSNIIIIGVLVAAFVGYSAYQQKQHKTTTGKKTI
ncbi:hypothetical protein MMC30_002550 [Trapelia coarctata]|nr:hypothetical protein [Trapelia coarctata]